MRKCESVALPHFLISAFSHSHILTFPHYIPAQKTQGQQTRPPRPSSLSLRYVGVFNLYSSVENHAETQRTQRREERTMPLTSHGNLNLKGFIHHFGDCRTLSVALVLKSPCSPREVITSNEKMNLPNLRQISSCWFQ